MEIICTLLQPPVRDRGEILVSSKTGGVCVSVCTTVQTLQRGEATTKFWYDWECGGKSVEVGRRRRVFTDMGSIMESQGSVRCT